MDAAFRRSAERVRSLLERGRATQSLFRAALGAVPPLDRDAWVDCALGIGAPPDDGPALPRGCVPYLPCSVDALLRLTEHAPLSASDVFVDIGSGVGRAVAVAHLLTGARAVGVEVQPALVGSARELAARLHLSGVSFVEGDAAQLPAGLAEPLAAGTVFFLYCPFSGDRLARVLTGLESLSRNRSIRVGCVNLPLPPCPWLELACAPSAELAIYRSRALR